MNSLYKFGYVMYACKNENRIDLVKTEFCFLKSICAIRMKGLQKSNFV